MTMAIGIRPLTAYQEQFVDQFLGPASEKYQMLIGPPQLGLAQCAREIVARLMAGEPNNRVLVLTGRMLVLQWLQRLQDALDSSLLMEGSRRNLRQLTEDIKPSDFLWPIGHVVVMDVWALERFADLQSSVFWTPWDLVVWDEFPSVSGNSDRVQLLERLEGHQEVRRLLVLCRDRQRLESGLEFPQFFKTVWDRSLLDLPEVRGQRIPIEEQTLFYQRTEGERELRKRLRELVERWPLEQSIPKGLSSHAAYSPAARLLPAAESSPLALQEFLQRMRPSKAAELLRQGTLLDASEPLDSTTPEISGEVGNIQELLDGISLDSKLETFLRYLRESVDNHHRVVVECRFSATARYLKSALMDVPWPIFIVTADLSPKQTLDIINDFEEKRGILISSVAALRGVEITADIVVPYDFADGWIWNAIGPRVRAEVQGSPVQVVRLMDSAGDRPLEESLEGQY